MSTFLFYEADDEAPTHRDDLDAALAALGVDFAAPADAAYRPGHWRDPATGATVIVDRGEVPLERDELHPPTAYAGWRWVGLSVQLPLLAPHWQAVEGLRWIAVLLARLPALVPLDCEDNRIDDDAAPGPFPFDRLRALASWERQHAAHTAGRQDLPRLERRASLALWRYRQQRPSGQIAHPQVFWPEALVLAEGARAVTVAVWADPAKPFALPPVSHLVIPRATAAGVLPVDEVLTAAGAVRDLGHGLAQELIGGKALCDLHQRAHLVPAARFTACPDGDWSD